MDNFEETKRIASLMMKKMLNSICNREEKIIHKLKDIDKVQRFLIKAINVIKTIDTEDKFIVFNKYCTSTLIYFLNDENKLIFNSTIHYKDKEMVNKILSEYEGVPEIIYG